MNPTHSSRAFSRVGRLAIIALIPCLLGAVTTVAVAWWYARQPLKIVRWTTPVTTEQQQLWSRVASDKAPAVPQLTIKGSIRGMTSLCMYGGSHTVGAVSFGIPARAIQFTYQSTGYDSQFNHAIVTGKVVGEALPLNVVDGTVLPLLPIWPGFLANTVIYALPWWIVWLIWTLARSRLRKRAGHCPKCDYNLRGSAGAGCPECGWGRTG